MDQQPVARIYWQAPHEAMLDVSMGADDVLVFGRAAQADIRIGHAPVYDPDVPRAWGELAWVRDRLYVTNISDVWGFDVVPNATTGRVSVTPGSSYSGAHTQFTIEAFAPGAKHAIHVVTRSPAPRLAQEKDLGREADDKSFFAISLTPTQRLVGSAVVAPIKAGRARRASYDEIAEATNYSKRNVREAIAAMDGLFSLHLLAIPGDGSDALDRVANTLTRHPALIG